MKLIQAYVFAMLVTGCMPVAGTYGGTSSYANPPVVATGVFVNGQELTAADKARLDWLLGYAVPAGSYFVTDAGMMGVVGQPATIDLTAYAQARGVAPTRRGSISGSGYSGDAITSDGQGCTIVSAGSLTYASGC